MTWKYLPVLNACIQVLVTIGLGVVLAKFKIFGPGFVPVAVRFVFYVALPCLVIRGIGLNIDFYSDAFIWEYICAFLILRAVALVLCFGSVFVERIKSPGSVAIGNVAVRWLSLTWISTVILGIPIMTALTGNPKRGAFFGLLAGISSFIFQLPLQLFFLECHALGQADQNVVSPHEKQSNEKDIESAIPVDTVANDSEEGGLSEEEEGIVPKQNRAETEKESEEVEVRSSGGDPFMVASLWLNKQIWTRILFKVLTNPVLWGIFLGLFLSLTTVGGKYLKPGQDDTVEGLLWIEATLAWFGACVSPLSLFAMGVWMYDQGSQLIAIGPRDISLFMISKLVLVPLIMVGLAKAFNLDDESGRAAVLIASLPISLASFTLAKLYNIGEAALSANVAVGTILMLPTVILWNVVMDELDLFTDYKN